MWIKMFNNKKTCFIEKRNKKTFWNIIVATENDDDVALCLCGSQWTYVSVWLSEIAVVPTSTTTASVVSMSLSFQ